MQEGSNQSDMIWLLQKSTFCYSHISIQKQKTLWSIKFLCLPQHPILCFVVCQFAKYFFSCHFAGVVIFFLSRIKHQNSLDLLCLHGNHNGIVKTIKNSHACWIYSLRILCSSDDMTEGQQTVWCWDGRILPDSGFSTCLGTKQWKQHWLLLDALEVSLNWSAGRNPFAHNHWLLLLGLQTLQVPVLPPKMTRTHWCVPMHKICRGCGPIDGMILFQFWTHCHKIVNGSNSQQLFFSLTQKTMVTQDELCCRICRQGEDALGMCVWEHQMDSRVCSQATDVGEDPVQIALRFQHAVTFFLWVPCLLRACLQAWLKSYERKPANFWDNSVVARNGCYAMLCHSMPTNCKTFIHWVQRTCSRHVNCAVILSISYP